MTGGLDIQPLRVVDVCALEGKPVPEREWLLDEWVPWGHVTALYGDGGTGKSLLAQQLMTATALGSHFLGMPVRQCRVLGLFCEDDEDELHRRQDTINRGMNCGYADLEDMQWISRVAAENILMSFSVDGVGEITPFFAQLSQYAKDFGAQLLVIDTAADTFGGNENARPQVRQYLGAGLTRLAREIGGCVLLTAHPSVSGRVGDGAGGSTAWSNSVRSRLYLSRPPVEGDDAPDDDVRILSRKKSNYARVGDELRLRFQDGAFVSDGGADPTEGGLFGRVRRDEAERAFLEGLALLTERGLRVNRYPNTANYAPKVLRDVVPLCAAFTVRELGDAMNRVMAADRVRVAEDGAPSRRRSYLVQTSRA